jgi:hypothetical protein
MKAIDYLAAWICWSTDDSKYIIPIKRFWYPILKFTAKTHFEKDELLGGTAEELANPEMENLFWELRFSR